MKFYVYMEKYRLFIVLHVYLQVMNWHLDTASLTRILKFFSTLAGSLHLCEYDLLIDWLACCYVDLLCVGAIYGICTADLDLNTRQVILHIIWMTV